MNSRSLRRDLKEMLAREGFRLLRAGPHDKWTDGRVVITVPGSPSCARSVENMKRDIRRKRRELAERSQGVS